MKSSLAGSADRNAKSPSAFVSTEIHLGRFVCDFGEQLLTLIAQEKSKKRQTRIVASRTANSPAVRAVALQPGCHTPPQHLIAPYPGDK
jgi:hypothetical protein